MGNVWRAGRAMWPREMAPTYPGFGPIALRIGAHTHRSDGPGLYLGSSGARATASAGGHHYVGGALSDRARGIVVADKAANRNRPSNIATRTMDCCRSVQAKRGSVVRGLMRSKDATPYVQCD